MANPPAPSATGAALPTAVPVRRRTSFAWLLPLVGLGLLGYFSFWAYEQQQFNVQLDVTDASGIKAFQTPVLCRGVEVGGVTAVTLHPGGRGASVQIRLQPSGLNLATADSDWWITRPELGLTAVRDVESLLAGPSIQFRPGVEKKADHFTAQIGPPADAGMSDGLRILLRSPDRGAVRPSTPVRYRGIAIGRVVSMRLPQDGRSVLMIVEVDRPYAHLVRNNSRFWHRHDATAQVTRLGLGLSGYQATFPRLNAALDISIDLAVPDPAGPPVSDDSVFVLEGNPPENPTTWAPKLGTPSSQQIAAQAGEPDPADDAYEPAAPEKKRGPIEGLFDLITPFN